MHKKIKKIKVNEGERGEEIKVKIKNSPKMSETADWLEGFSDREFKKVVKIAKELRRAKRHAKRGLKINVAIEIKSDDGRTLAKTLNNLAEFRWRDFRKTVRVAKKLRAADAEIKKAKEKRAVLAGADDAKATARWAMACK